MSNRHLPEKKTPMQILGQLLLGIAILLGVVAGGALLMLLVAAGSCLLGAGR